MAVHSNSQISGDNVAILKVGISSPKEKYLQIVNSKRPSMIGAKQARKSTQVKNIHTCVYFLYLDPK